jgi:hypothetical protein
MASNNTKNTQGALDPLIEIGLLSLTIMPRPDASRGLTGWFVSQLREEGYRGHTCFFLEGFYMVLVVKDEGKPSQAELEVSDEMLFSLFDTRTMEVFDDGTSMLFPKYDEAEQEEQQGKNEEEADWEM